MKLKTSYVQDDLLALRWHLIVDLDNWSLILLQIYNSDPKREYRQCQV